MNRMRDIKDRQVNSYNLNKREAGQGMALRLALCLCLSFFLSFLILCLDIRAEDTVGQMQGQEDTNIQLTKEEQTYLHQHSKLRMAVDSQWIPISYERGGSYCGIMANILEKISQISGIEFEYVFADTYAQALELVRNGEAEAVAGFVEDPKVAEENQVCVTAPYLEIDYSAMSKKNLTDVYNHMGNYSTAVVAEDYANQLIEKEVMDAELVPCDSSEECLKSVKRGKTDLAVIASYCAEYYANKPANNDLKLFPIKAYSWELGVGVRRNQNQHIISILNKAIGLLTESDVSQASYVGMLDATSQTDWTYYLYMHPVPFAVGMALTILFIMWVSYQIWQSTSNVKKQLKRDRDGIGYAIDCAGLSVFEYDFKTHRVHNLSNKGELDDILKYARNLPESLFQSNVVHPDDVENMRSVYTRVLEGEEQVKGTWRIRRKDKEDYGWKQTTFYIIRDENGTPISALGVNEDVTEDIESKEYIHKMNRFRRAIQTGSIGSYELDVDDVLTGRFPKKEYEGYHKIMAEPVLTGHRRRYMEFTDAANLKNLYEEGITESRQQFQFMNSQLELVWGEAEVKLLIDESTGHLICYHTIRDIDAKKRLELQLKEKAERDDLTALYNRQTFKDMVVQVLKERKKEPMGCAFFMIDLDDFKELNDTYGHDAGDLALKALGGELLHIFRTYDVIGRLGGDEFTVMMVHVRKMEDIQNKARDLCIAVGKMQKRYGWGFSLSCSVGVAVATDELDDFDSLYKKADEALYEAKKKGKNQFYIGK